MLAEGQDVADHETEGYETVVEPTMKKTERTTRRQNHNST